MPLDDDRLVNLRNWEERTPIHAQSESYDLAGMIAEPSRLSGVVERERPLLPDLAGRDVVHLQCHIGTDTLSLARLGAGSVTGLDFSPSALAVARQLAAEAGVAIDYVESELYDAVAALGPERFDVVYTGVGAIGWLPDIRGWARVVAGLLRPGGCLHLHEGHPVLFTIDHERKDGLLVMNFPYFETAEAIVVDDGPGTYTDGDASGMVHTETREWNHGLGQIVQAVIEAGLTLTMLQEHDYCDWLALPHIMSTFAPDGASRLDRGRERLPLSYTLQARKP